MSIHRALESLLIPLCALAGATGCAAKKTLSIVSDPPGALIRIDEEIVGTSPYVMRFEHYGTHRITLYRDGYRTFSKLVPLAPPWYGRFPFDIFSEVLIPVGWRDERKVEITLEPQGGIVTEPDLEAVLRRAESLRLAGPEGPRPIQ